METSCSHTAAMPELIPGVMHSSIRRCMNAVAATEAQELMTMQTIVIMSRAG